jgi:hypothetical protein
VKARHFHPPESENAHCSFMGNFTLMEDGSLRAWAQGPRSCCGGTRDRVPDPAAKARSFVARQWSAPSIAGRSRGPAIGDMEAFLERGRTHGFSISAMAFQDAWNVDLERLRECHIHVVASDAHVASGARIVPFCAYNITDARGRSLYRGLARERALS